MNEALFSPTPDRAPELAAGEWLNTPHPLRLAALRGQAVVLHFLDGTHLPTRRTLSYLYHWHARYSRIGLTVIGVHTPMFSFGRERTQVEREIDTLDIPYPVLMDSDYRTWKAYHCRVLPTRILIDRDGAVRQRDEGESGYAVFEQAVQAVLRDGNSLLDLPDIIRDEYPTETRGRATPELRAGQDGGALGNPEGYGGSVPMLYRLPEQRTAGAFYVGGAWQAGHEYLAYHGTTEGQLRLPYEAGDVYAVLSPHADVVERMLHPEIVSIEVWQDDKPITDEQRGADVTEDGRILLDRPRLYHLIRNRAHGRHELAFRVHARGFAVYAFSFVAGSPATSHSK